MALYEDRFAAHGVHLTLDQLAAAVNQDVDFDIDETARAHLAHLQQSTAFIHSRLEVASPVLTTSAQLDPILASITAALKQSNQCFSQKNGLLFADAANSIEAGIIKSTALPTLEKSIPGFKAEDALQFSEAVGALVDQLSQESIQTMEELKALQSKMESLSEGLSESNAELTRLEAKTANAIEELSSKSGEEVTRQKNQNSAALDAFQATFNTEIENREKAFQAMLESHDQAREEDLSELTKTNVTHLEELANLKGRAEKIVGMIENTGLTGNFQRTAKQERKTANVLRFFAIISYFVMVLLVLTSAFDWLGNTDDKAATPFKVVIGLDKTPDPNTTLASSTQTIVDEVATDIEKETGYNPWKTFFRLIAALILLIPARYLGGEAARHSRLAERNRRIELELAAIDAYFADLTPEERAVQKNVFAEKYFGQIDELTPENEPDSHYSDLLGLLKEAIKRR